MAAATQKIVVSIMDANGNTMVPEPLTFKPPQARDVIVQEILDGGHGVGHLLDEDGDTVTRGSDLPAGNYKYRVTGVGGAAGVSGNFHPLRRVLSVEAMHLVEHAAFLIKEDTRTGGSDGMDVSSSGGASSDSKGASSGATSGGRPSSGNKTGSSGAISSTKYVGAGVFVTAKLAVTANHNLAEIVVGSSLNIVLPKRRVVRQVRVVVRNDEFDYAVLECESAHTHYLRLYNGDLDALRGEPLALCAFQVGIREELPEFATGMGVMRAEGVKLSKKRHHLVYTCSTWPGDSGAALVMYDGQLVGLHIAGVNALREKFDRECGVHERLAEVEDSLEDAARSTASGCIALLASTFADTLAMIEAAGRVG